MKSLRIALLSLWVVMANACVAAVYSPDAGSGPAQDAPSTHVVDSGFLPNPLDAGSRRDADENEEETTCDDAEFAVRDGVAVFEAESTESAGNWHVENDVAGHSGDGYVIGYEEGEYAEMTVLGPGIETLRYRVQVPAGVYRLFIRSHVGPDGAADDPNDVWGQVVDREGESIAYTRDDDGARIDPADARDGRDGWGKVYSYEPEETWTWSTLTGHGQPFFVEVESDEVIDVLLSVRSPRFLIDRVALISSDRFALESSEPEEFRRIADELSLQTREESLCREDATREEESDDDRVGVWVTSDLSDPTPPPGGSNGDPDDVAGLIALLLMGHRLDLRGITLDVTSREYQNGFEYVRDDIVPAYGEIADELRARDSRYLTRSELDARIHGAPPRSYDRDLEVDDGDSADLLYEEALRHSAERPLFVLNWGALTDVAIAVRQGVRGGAAIDSRIVVVSHATQGGNWNRTLDREAADYLRMRAEDGHLRFYELQDVNDAFHNEGNWGDFDCGDESDSFEPILENPLGRHLDQGSLGRTWDDRPWMDGQVDFSDASTFLVLLGYGGGLDAIALSDGSYHNAGSGVRDRLCDDRSTIVADLLSYADRS